MVRLTAQQMALQMVPLMAQRSAHLTARLMSQQMKRQKAQLAGRLPAHRSDTQTAYQPAQWMVLQMAQCRRVWRHCRRHR